jgi:alpha-galactosidase
MLIVGKVGWGGALHPTRLTKNEQITHITMWVLLAAPLLLGCDLTQLDPFTLDLLTNDEVLDVDQDVLGKQGWKRAETGQTEVYARPLSDGTLAVGLFNKGRTASVVAARWTDLGLHGAQRVRDLWRRKDAGTFDHEFRYPVPPHGAVLVKIGPPK